MTEWIPWETYKADGSLLDIPEIVEPPCKNCIHWRPQRVYEAQITPGRGQYFEGVRLCHAPAMESDFSCFRPREEKPLTVNSEIDKEAFMKP